MAAVERSDIPQVADFFTDFWKFVKSVWIPEGSDSYCEEAFLGACVLLNRYPDNFCRGQVLAFLDYLDSKWTEGRGQ